jgi:hypothetical protein
MKPISSIFYPEHGCGGFLRNVSLTYKITKLGNPDLQNHRRETRLSQVLFFSILSIYNGVDDIGLLESFNQISIRITNVKYVLQVHDDSAVSTETGYGLDAEGFSSSPGRFNIFILSTSSRPSIFLSNGHRGSFLGGKAAGAADHAPPTNSGVKNTWIYSSTSPYALIAQCLISQVQGILIFFLPFT